MTAAVVAAKTDRLVAWREDRSSRQVFLSRVFEEGFSALYR